MYQRTMVHGLTNAEDPFKLNAIPLLSFGTKIDTTRWSLTQFLLLLHFNIFFEKKYYLNIMCDMIKNPSLCPVLLPHFFQVYVLFCASLWAIFLFCKGSLHFLNFLKQLMLIALVNVGEVQKHLNIYLFEKTYTATYLIFLGGSQRH